MTKKSSAFFNLCAFWEYFLKKVFFRTHGTEEHPSEPVKAYSMVQYMKYLYPRGLLKKPLTLESIM